MSKKPSSVLITLEIEGLPGDPFLRARCARRARQLLGRLSVAPTSARIHFTDENGPKGGVSVRCAITVPIPRRAPVHVAHIAAMHGTAFDGALDMLERRLAQGRRRQRDAGRRPKKYYLAKRAMLDGLTGATGTA